VGGSRVANVAGGKAAFRWSLKNVEDQQRTCVAPSSVSLSSNCHAGPTNSGARSLALLALSVCIIKRNLGSEYACIV